jgi:hypothetical protein
MHKLLAVAVLSLSTVAFAADPPSTTATKSSKVVRGRGSVGTGLSTAGSSAPAKAKAAPAEEKTGG